MTFEKLKAIILAKKEISADKITMTASIAKDIGADSLDIVEMLIDVEDTFGIVIEDEDVPNFKTVGDVVEYIDAKRAK